jgi:hypothetical protein
MNNYKNGFIGGILFLITLMSFMVAATFFN